MDTAREILRGLKAAQDDAFKGVGTAREILRGLKAAQDDAFL
ncbi:MAG TPA: hypothetical protein VEG08_11770 [Terriglobales bacterium]|nr:hypothetical protein [Terriglobales bacterium]